jgi:hypothetical protein
MDGFPRKSIASAYASVGAYLLERAFWIHGHLASPVRSVDMDGSHFMLRYPLPWNHAGGASRPIYVAGRNIFRSGSINAPNLSPNIHQPSPDELDEQQGTITMPPIVQNPHSCNHCQRILLKSSFKDHHKSEFDFSLADIL